MKSLKETLHEHLDTNVKLSPFEGLSLLTESNLNRIMKNADEHGIIIISANRDYIESDISACDLSNEYKRWLEKNYYDTDDDKVRKEFLSERNKAAYKELYNKIKHSQYSYSQVYGEFKGTDNVIANYEPSFLIYCVDRKGNGLPFDELFEFGKELCEEFNQESFFAQAPGEAPNHYNYKGEQVNIDSSKFVKFNQEKYFTTIKRKKNGGQRFTSDIRYESIEGNALGTYLFEYYTKEDGIEYYSKIKRTQLGEDLLL